MTQTRALSAISILLSLLVGLTGCFGPSEPECVGQQIVGSGCDPQNPGAVYRVDECGDFVDVKDTCQPGHVCGESEFAAGMYVCVEDPNDCRANGESRGCDPGGLEQIVELDGCGEVLEVIEECEDAEVCDESGNRPMCIKDDSNCVNDPEYSSCNPDDPSQILRFDGCGEVLEVIEECEGAEVCDASGSRPRCVKDDSNCVNDPEYSGCDSDDPSQVFRFDGCGEPIKTIRTCSPGRKCGESELVAGTFDCVADPDSCEGGDRAACNPDDTSAVYNYDKCGEPIDVKTQCEDHEVCKEEGSRVFCDEDPTDCRNQGSSSGCNPDDLSATYRVDGCGDPIEVLLACAPGKLCEVKNGSAICNRDCSDAMASVSCNRADPFAIYYKNSCGEFSDKMMECDVANREVCDDSSGTPQCVRDCGSSFAQKVCVDGDEDQVHYANECGEITGRASLCLAVSNKVCGGPQGDARCVTGCGDPQTDVTCTSSDPGALYYEDRCGNVTSKVMDCDASNFEVCKTIAGVAQCARSCGSNFAHRVCDPAQPLGRFYANECGVITQQFWTCDAANFEVCDDSSGSAKCVQDCGSDTMVQEVCDPRDPSAIHWADQCGNITTKKMDCPAQHECDDSSGSPVCSLNCGGNTVDHTRCDPSNPRVIANANACDNIVGTAQYCSTANHEVCDDSTGSPTCVQDCGSPTTEIVCDPNDPGALYNANACGDVTTKFADCDAVNFEVCDDSSGVATCTRDCGSRYAQKVCNPSNSNAIYYADGCGEITTLSRVCNTSNFEVCDDSSGTAQCVQDCGAPDAQTTCVSQDPGAIYYADACGAPTTKLVDCDTANFETCDDSSGVAQCVRDCGSSHAQKVCVAGEPGKVYYANECGDITGAAQSCLAVYNKICTETIAGQASCDTGCGDPMTGEACNPSDPDAIYWTDRCGAATTKKSDCDANNFEVCKSVNGAPTCVRDCGSNRAGKVCDPNDPGAVYYTNECGEITTRYRTCSASRFEVCNDSSGEAACVPDCGSAMSAQVCDPLDRSAVYWANQCGETTTKLMDCPAQHRCDDSSGTPTCTLDCGSSRAQKVCDPSKPATIAWANACGEVTSTYTYCSTSNFETCDDSSGTAQCVRDCGSPTTHTACDPADPGAVYNANACGEITSKIIDCDAANFEVCDDSSGSAVCARDCGSRFTSKVCNPVDVQGIYYANACGEPTQRYRGCDQSNFEVCDDSSGTPTCRRECGGPMARLVCDASNPSAIHHANNCGEATSIASMCDVANNEVCSDVSGTPECVTDCGSSNAIKACNPADPTSIYNANLCGEISTKSRTCSQVNFEVCDDSSGMAQCVRDCGSDREQLVCDSSDPGAVYYANGCGEVTSKATDCDAANFEVCDDSSGDAVCARDCGSNSDHKVCDPVDPDAVYWANECGEITSKFTDCNNGKLCGDYNGSASCLCEPTEQVACFGTNQLYSPSGIAVVDSCGIVTDTVVESCLNGEVCREIEGNPTCYASVTDESSEYYIRGCTLNLFLDAPTDLPMDCRCRRATSGTGMNLGDGIIQCWPIGVSWNRGHRYANGPHFYSVSTNRQSGGGVLDPTTGKIYFAFNWSDSNYTEAGIIGVFDHTTGDREVLSGVFNDPALGYQVYGSGHLSPRFNSNGGQLEMTALPYIEDVELGADGYLYALGSDTSTNVEITRVDKITGERTLMWKREVPGQSTSFGQCRGPRQDPSYATGFSPVQYGRRAFALDPQGNYYLSFSNGFDGMGVVKISADGSTCTIISRNASTTPADAPDIGSGYSPQYSLLSGMLYRNGKLYAYATLGERMIEYDVATGNRALYTEPNVLGTGSPVIGETTMWFDDARGLMMTAGATSAYRLVAVDPVTRDRQNMLQDINQAAPLIPGAYPAGQGQPLHGGLDNGNAVQFGAVVPDPNDPDMIYFVLVQGALVKYEMSTGNSYIMSL